MAALKLQFALLAFLALSITLPLHSRAQQSATKALSVDEIVSRMEAARIQIKPTGPFLLQREYRMYRGEDSNPVSRVRAEINVVPPRERDYRIVESKGNGRGEKVVRKILDHEVEAEKSTPPPTAIIRDNYDFELLGQDTFQGSRCHLVRLKPRRKNSALVDGRAWIDSNTFLVRKIEGQLSKSPSWWVKDVNLTVLFGEVGGIWMQTATNAVADVRLAGRYTVSGWATGVRTSSAVASRQTSQKKVRRRVSAPAAAVYNTGVLVSR